MRPIVSRRSRRPSRAHRSRWGDTTTCASTYTRRPWLHTSGVRLRAVDGDALARPPCDRATRGCARYRVRHDLAARDVRALGRDLSRLRADCHAGAPACAGASARVLRRDRFGGYAAPHSHILPVHTPTRVACGNGCGCGVCTWAARVAIVALLRRLPLADRKQVSREALHVALNESHEAR